LHPIFSADGSKVYFSSSRTGIFNIFSYNIKQNTLSQITNVLTGLFQPMLGQAGEIYVQSFAVDKSSIQKFSSRNVNSKLLTIRRAAAKRTASLEGQQMPWSALGRTAPALPPTVNVPLHDSEDTVVSQNFFLENLNVSFADPVRNHKTDSTNTLEPETETPTQDPTRHTVPDSEPVLPVQTDGRYPETRPQERTIRKKEKKIVQQAVSETAPSAPKVFPSVYKKALFNLPSDIPVVSHIPEGSKKYSAFPHILRPSYIVPNIQALDNAALVALQIGRVDPLYRHSWVAFADYRSDAKNLLFYNIISNRK
jgi:hypothetical protein